MRGYILSFLASIIIMQRVYCATITPIESFNDVDFDAIDRDTLVVFDVDDTLIQPRDIYAMHKHTIHSRSLNKILAERYPSLTEDECWELSTVLFEQIERPLIELCVIEKINGLKKRNVSVIACTGMKTGEHRTIQRLEVWRYNHLKSLGFEGSYNEYDLVLHVPSGRKPVFYKGVLVTDFDPKGIVMGAFLDALALLPKTLVVFDDKESYLLSLSDECARRNISFRGYLYCGAKRKQWDDTLINFKIDYLVKYKNWLSDEQAQRTINEQRQGLENDPI